MDDENLRYELHCHVKFKQDELDAYKEKLKELENHETNL